MQSATRPSSRCAVCTFGLSSRPLASYSTRPPKREREANKRSNVSSKFDVKPSSSPLGKFSLRRLIDQKNSDDSRTNFHLIPIKRRATVEETLRRRLNERLDGEYGIARRLISTNRTPHSLSNAERTALSDLTVCEIILDVFEVLLKSTRGGIGVTHYEGFKLPKTTKVQEGDPAIGASHVDPELLEWVNEFGNTLRALIRITVQDKGSRQTHTFKKLRNAFERENVQGLKREFHYTFVSYYMSASFSPEDVENQTKIADLSYPMEWFPATRALQREVHLHIGPTNSGKTYQALKRLESAESGIYAGPLRLLAHEVYTRLTAKGKMCALITGEERRFPNDNEEDAKLSSCTVEMVPLNRDVEVAVIDEIQMLGDQSRGWAWTQAFLGLKAKEVHLCGEARTKPIIQSLCRAMGDKLIVHEYERLSPLKSMKTNLGSDLKKLEKGDCIIVFSRVGIHAMKNEIEAATGKRCAVVYGSLPPETRAQQANLFNDPDNDYDFLCASDAVGMGLNLSIKRIIFEATSKHDGISFRTLSIPELKQIAGRAGRFRTAAQATEEEADIGSPEGNPKMRKESESVGLVTSLESFDMKFVRAAMKNEAAPVETAGIQAPSSIIARFASYFPPATPFSYVLLRLHEISKTSPTFHLCNFKDQIAVADAIQEYDMPMMDRLIFLQAPTSLRDPGAVEIMKALAQCVTRQTGGELLDIAEIHLELLDQEGGKGKEYLADLEVLHRALTLYLWLSYRFAGVFRSQKLAFYVKSLVEEKIDACLAEVHMTEVQKKTLAAARKRLATKDSKTLDADKVDGIVVNVTAEDDNYGNNVADDTSMALPVDWNTGDGILEDIAPLLEADKEPRPTGPGI